MSESKTTRLPSGNQRGDPELDCNEVNCTGFEPSPLQSQISEWPDRFELNTIFEPSEEYRAESSPRVEAISFTGALNLARPDTSVRQMSWSAVQCAYTRRFPWREMVGCTSSGPTEAKGCGFSAPDKGTLHSLPSPQRWPAKQTISWPFPVQAGLRTDGWEKSRCRSSPADW